MFSGRHFCVLFNCDLRLFVTRQPCLSFLLITPPGNRQYTEPCQTNFHLQGQARSKCLLTFELDGTQDQRLAVVFWPQVSGRTSVAATAAAGIVVGGLAYQDLALDVHRLCGSQELEGLKCEAGVVPGARDVVAIGVVHSTAKSEAEVVL